MIRYISIVTVALVLAAGSPAQTGGLKPIPEGGVSLLPGEGIKAFKLIGAGAREGEMEVVAAEGPGFKEALRVRTKARPANAWALQVATPVAGAANKGDVILVSFWARRVESRAESGEARTEVVFERRGEPYTKSVEALVAVGPEWKRFDFPARAVEAYTAAPGAAGAGAQVNFRVGYEPQVLELADIRVLNYGTKVKLGDLPQVAATYPGREPNAPWRKEAAERIERIRKGDLTVSVTAGGQPVGGAQVQVKMTRHAFGFGSAVTVQMLNADTPDGQKYRETIAKLYNKVVFENDLKWPGWERQDRAATLKAIGWLKERRIAIRGHCLVWPSWRYTPRDVAELKSNPAALRERVAKHVSEEAGALKGLLAEWDVINEPYTNHDIMDVLGKDVMVEWFKLARAADPDTVLYLNDYSILTGGGLDKAHQDHFEATLKYLKEQGAPIGGLGMQGHFGRTLTDPAKVVQILDRFAKLGLSISITEHDIDITDEQLQAEYTRDFLTALFSHEQVVAFLTWGFWEARHWKPNGAYFRRDWSIKPAGEAFVDLVTRQWWTNAAGKTGADGAYAARGFCGEYQVTVTHGGKSKTVPAVLKREGAKVAVSLE